MSKELYHYTVYDEKTHICIARNKRLVEVADIIGVKPSAVLTAIDNGYKVHHRYVVTKNRIDGTYIQKQNEGKSVKMYEGFEQEWTDACNSVRKALCSPEAVERFLHNRSSGHKGRNT